MGEGPGDSTGIFSSLCNALDPAIDVLGANSDVPGLLLSRDLAPKELRELLLSELGLLAVTESRFWSLDALDFPLTGAGRPSHLLLTLGTVDGSF